MLNEGGHLYIVIRKSHGAASSIKELETLFKEVEIIDVDKGYVVIDSSNWYSTHIIWKDGVNETKIQNIGFG